VALVVGDLATQIPAIPPVGALLPKTGRRRPGSSLRPCGTAAARRRHFLRREPQDDLCREWHRQDMAARRAVQRRASRHRNLWHTVILTTDDFDLYGAEFVA
jgi:hypothetical protein